MVDHIIGCGQRHGSKYFLIRFKGQEKYEIVDWESAKQYSVDIMEFFGSRTVWTEMQNIIDPDVLDDFEEDAERETEVDEHVNRPSTSNFHQLDACPNEIEFDK